MITIGKIREKSGLLIGVIGGAMVLYVLGQALTSAGSQGGEAQSQGEIYGEPVDAQHLNELEQQFLMMQKQMAAQQQRDFTEKDSQEAADKAWNEYVREALLGKEFKALGIEVSEGELDAYMFGTDGFTPPPMLAQYFPDTLRKGQIDFNALKQFQEKALNNEQVQNGVDQYNQPTYFKYADFWNEMRNNLRQSREADKYVALLKKGIYATTIEAKSAYNNSKTVKKIKYIERPYADKFEKTLISDVELKTYYEAHKNEPKYEQKAARNIAYVSFEIKPSEQDLANGMEKMQALYTQFTQAKNDSLFVMMNSESPKFSSATACHMAAQEGEPNTYPESMDSIIQKATIGQVVGPYANGDKVTVAKILNFTDQKQAWVRHILITAGGKGQISFDAAQKKADSLVLVINEQHNFVELVETVSEDPGSVKNKGEYKWFAEGRMVAPFNDYAFNAPLNTIGTVKTNYGIHIVEVLGRRVGKLPHLAIVNKTIRPSESTISDIEQKAKDFWSVADANPKDFEKIAKDSGYFVRPASIFLEKPQINSFSATAQSLALRFAFDKNAIESDVSDAIKDNNRFVVIQLTSIVEEGVPTLEHARKIMEIDAKNDKIATTYLKEMKGLDLQTAGKKFDIPVKNGEVTFISASIGRKSEPTVTGVIYSGNIKEGATSPAIKGKTGIYMAKIIETTPAPPTKDYSGQKADLLNRTVSIISREALLSLIEYADVKDYRIQNRIGAR